jgi:hypothetical protein
MRRQPQLALPWLRKSVGLSPQIASFRFFLASALAHLGEIAEARISMTRMLELRPADSISRHRRIRQYANVADFEYVLKGARLAGLPEE